jgi:hypothetical protein
MAAAVPIVVPAVAEAHGETGLDGPPGPRSWWMG